MTRSHRLTLWLGLVLSAVLVLVAVALWLRGTLSGDTDSTSPIPPSSQPSGGVSPLSTPAPSSAEVVAPPRPWVGVAVLLWVVLGVVLASGITFFILRRYRDDA